MIKGSIQQDGIIILNIYGPLNSASIHMKQRLKEPQGERNKSTIVLGDFSTFVSTTGRTIRQKIKI